MADSRQTILAALRKGLADNPSPVLAPAPAPSMPSLPEGNAAWEAFRTALSRIRVELDVARDADQAKALLLKEVESRSVRKVALWETGLPVDAASWLREAGVAVVFGGESGCQAFADAGLGVTGVAAAFLNTGTLLVRAGKGTPRGASLLPPVHLALVPRSALVASTLALPGLLREAKAEGMPSAFHTITGPSSTSDIELFPVFGVHGPTTLMVLGLDFC